MVFKMYLRAGITLPSVSSAHPGIPRIVANGTIINIAIPDNPRPAISHDFRVGDTSDPWTPPYVIPKAPSTYTFINTGRHLLIAFDVLFDATFGYYGLIDVPQWCGNSYSTIRLLRCIDMCLGSNMVPGCCKEYVSIAATNGLTVEICECNPNISSPHHIKVSMAGLLVSYITKNLHQSRHK